MPRLNSQFALILASIAALVSVIFAAVVMKYRREFQSDIEQRLIERDAAVLHPVVQKRLSELEVLRAKPIAGPDDVLDAVLKNPVFEENTLGIVVFNHDGNAIQSVPSASLLFADLSIDDYLRLHSRKPISRFHPSFALNRYFLGVGEGRPPEPVLEVLLPLQGGTSRTPVAFVQYFLNAQNLARELAAIQQANRREIALTLAIGIALILAIVIGAYFALARSQRALTEREGRLARANFELALAAKVSALGQITSHLIHGLQGPVAGLRAFVAEKGGGADSPEWQAAATYAARMQDMIHEAVALLGDASAHASYEITGYEISTLIRSRNLPLAAEKGVLLRVAEGFESTLDSHRGSLLCLIANNLVQNAIHATPAGRRVDVDLHRGLREIVLTVSDEGSGIPETVAAHLFEPGRTGRSGGSGLGLAISRLLARQMSADLSLASTSAKGTSFVLRVPTHDRQEPQKA